MGAADVIQEHPSRPNYVPSYLAINVTSTLPRHSAREILFTKKLMGTRYIAKVSVNGQDMCCKMLAPYHIEAVQREYESLKKIADSKHASSIRAPKLIGFGGGDGDEGVIGILEEYIPHTMTLNGSRRGIITVATSERRRKWAEQVRCNVELLHEIGVVWGDGKPKNVLINSETDDCYLIDFGGSWTDGWVDAKLMETKAGDEQALTRILDFLGV
jgi:serine/threonine protein kinase